MGLCAPRAQKLIHSTLGNDMSSTSEKPLQESDACVLLAMSLVPGIGNRSIHQVLDLLARHDRRPACLSEVSRAVLSDEIPGFFRQFDSLYKVLHERTLSEAELCMVRAAREGLDWLYLSCPDYPSPLKYFLGNDAPPVLFTKGNRGLLHEEACAVVGTRTPSPRGLVNARFAAEKIVGAGLVLASGGAQGVDWAAHDAAISADGATTLFLPQGIGTYRIPGPWRKALTAGKLLLVSEYLPDAPWRTYAAVSRNALIAAQSRVVCVIEPRKQGGSILTARHAIHQGKVVLVDALEALPGTLRPHATRLEQLETVLNNLPRGEHSHLSQAPEQSRFF